MRRGDDAKWYPFGGALQAFTGEIRVSGNADSSLPSVRFVVLIHDEPGGGRHFDLMIEQGGALATWRFPTALEQAAASPISMERLSDHRLHYLSYEGPISGNRGSVTRYDEGECRVVSQDDRKWIVDFGGRRLAGMYQLLRADAASQSWSLSSGVK